MSFESGEVRLSSASRSVVVMVEEEAVAAMVTVCCGGPPLRRGKGLRSSRGEQKRKDYIAAVVHRYYEWLVCEYAAINTGTIF